jgi:hypothetical protein
MKNSIIESVIIISLILSPFCWGKYSGGTGEPNNPYLIATPEDLNAIGDDPNDWNKHFLMTADVNMSDYTYTIALIAPDTSSSSGFQGKSFTGVFDGNGHAINNFTWNSPSSDYVGLFGFVSGTNAEILNLGIVDANVYGSESVGSLIGCLGSGKVARCFVRSGWVIGESSVGGLVGSVVEGEVLNCYSTASVSAAQNAGGFIGAHTPMCGSGDTTLICCYSAGRVLGHQDIIGGFMGWAGSNLKSFQCLWDKQASGQSDSCTGIGFTTSRMMAAGTFIGWGCELSWKINDGNDYPRLAWEPELGELIVNPTYGGGSGTEEDPFLICTPEDLNVIGLVYCHLDKHFRLVTDLNLGDRSQASFNTIGTGSFPFTGIFDGSGNQIRNFSYKTNDWTDSVGLFGYVCGENATIMNLGLLDPNINSSNGSCIGALAGHVKEATISNCYVAGGKVSGDDSLGGLIGCLSNGSLISDCWVCSNILGHIGVGGLVGSMGGRVERSFSVSSVKGLNNIGGLVGCSNYAYISESFANCDVNALDANPGGLVGRCDYTTILDCYAQGSVKGKRYAGGFAGECTSGNYFRSYSACNVTGLNSAGGFIGWECYRVPAYKSCFWDKTLNPDLLSVGSPNSNVLGIIGLDTIELMQQNTYTVAGWDFITPIWEICPDTNDYPHLWWEHYCNKIPVAVAGPNQTVYAFINGLADVTLDGSASYDDDNDPLDYYWSWYIDSNLYEANVVSPIIQLPVGQHQIELVVDDGIDLSEPDYCTITVIEPLKTKLWLWPMTLYCNSRTRYVTTLVYLPKGIEPADFDNEPLTMYPCDIQSKYQRVFRIGYGRYAQTVVMAIFDKNKICDYFDTGWHKVEVAGRLQSGRYFCGSSMLRITRPWPNHWPLRKFYNRH